MPGQNAEPVGDIIEETVVASTKEEMLDPAIDGLGGRESPKLTSGQPAALPNQAEPDSFAVKRKRRRRQ